MSHCNILEMKLGNDKFSKPAIVVLKQGYKCNFHKGHEGHNQSRVWP